MGRHRSRAERRTTRRTGSGAHSLRLVGLFDRPFLFEMKRECLFKKVGTKWGLKINLKFEGMRFELVKLFNYLFLLNIFCIIWRAWQDSNLRPTD